MRNPGDIAANALLVTKAAKQLNTIVTNHFGMNTGNPPVDFI
jgi:hypothetical protein